MGSGLALQAAINKYGKAFFRKEILHFFKNEEELIAFEARIVNTDFVKQKDNYNLIEGGWSSNIESRKDYWESETGIAFRKELSQKFTGYKNPDFIRRWKPIYDSVLDDFVDYVLNTNLPDRFIIKQITNNMDGSIKFDRIMKYAIHQKRINKVIEINKYRDYLTPTLEENTIRKTEADGPTKSATTIYKACRLDYLDDFNYVLSILKDNTITDSMLFNNLLGLKSSRSIMKLASYYEYLGLIKHSGFSKVMIRKRLPSTQRKIGKKSIFNINNNFKQTYRLIGKDINCEYAINFDGTALSVSRI